VTVIVAVTKTVTKMMGERRKGAKDDMKEGAKIVEAAEGLPPLGTVMIPLVILREVLELLFMGGIS
jgi:hypothetical protein